MVNHQHRHDHPPQDLWLVIGGQVDPLPLVDTERCGAKSVEPESQLEGLKPARSLVDRSLAVRSYVLHRKGLLFLVAFVLAGWVLLAWLPSGCLAPLVQGLFLGFGVFDLSTCLGASGANDLGMLLAGYAPVRRKLAIELADAVRNT